MASSSESSRSLKRPRVKLEDEDRSPHLDLSKCHRHKKLYIATGNVVLVCETTLFKVYDGYLVNDAIEFQEMLSTQHVQIERHDECPLLRLQVSAQDMEYFLSALLFSE